MQLWWLVHTCTSTSRERESRPSDFFWSFISLLWGSRHQLPITRHPVLPISEFYSLPFLPWTPRLNRNRFASTLYFVFKYTATFESSRGMDSSFKDECDLIFELGIQLELLRPSLNNETKSKLQQQQQQPKELCGLIFSNPILLVLCCCVVLCALRSKERREEGCCGLLSLSLSLARLWQRYFQKRVEVAKWTGDPLPSFLSLSDTDFTFFFFFFVFSQPLTAEILNLFSFKGEERSFPDFFSSSFFKEKKEKKKKKKNLHHVLYCRVFFVCVVVEGGKGPGNVTRKVSHTTTQHTRQSTLKEQRKT